MASANIAFDTIPASIRRPLVYSEFNTRLALNGLSANRQKMVIVAQKTAEGTQLPHMPVDVFSDDQAAQLAGPGSIAHQMVVAALKANRRLALSMVLLADSPQHSAASASLSLEVVTPSSGVVRFSIGGVAMQIVATVASTSTSLAIDLMNVVNQQPNLGVLAETNGDIVTLGAKNRGELGNRIVWQFDLTASDFPPGLNFPGFVNARVPFTGGNGSPDITPALTAVFTAGSKLMACPYTDDANLLALRGHLAETGNSTEKRGCFCWFGSTATLAQATGLAGGRNDERMGVALLRGTHSAPWAVASAMAAIDAGEEDPTRPLNTLELAGLHVPAVADWLGNNEMETCLYSGVTPLEVGPGGRVQVVRAITTYTRNPLNAPDAALLDRTTIKALDYARTVYTNDQKIRFAREKITERTLRAVRVRAYELALLLEELEIFRNVNQFKDDFIVELDLQDASRINMKIPAPVVPGLHVLASRFDLYLQF